ncbi:MAG TPA: DUF1003 domain-containing protein [Candidatus Moranbacteria bacterium]|nr:DUF1003 domain-containing protein [Candidatus Moranbacteria bacterium]
MGNNKPTKGQLAADRIAEIVGSWKFILIQSAIVITWVIFNIIAIIDHWDPYPFILLNLVLGVQSAYTAPIILMSQNRAAERDRKKFEIDLSTDRKAEREIEQIQAQIEKLEKDKIDKILDILKK